MAEGTVSISLEMLETQANEIKEIDSKITAAGGNDAAARKAVIDEILTANKESVDSSFANLMESFKAAPPELLVGLMARLEEAMKADLKTMTDSVVDERVKANAGEQVNVDALKETRKAKIEAFRALRTILESLGVKTEAIEEPKRSGGGRPSGSGGSSSQKTGRNKEQYRYTMDGKDRPVSQNSFSSLAYYATTGMAEDGTKALKADGTVDSDSRMSAGALKTYIAANGVNFPTDEKWELELANGKKIGAYRWAPVEETPAETPAETTTDNGEASTPAEVPATV